VELAALFPLFSFFPFSQGMRSKARAGTYFPPSGVTTFDPRSGMMIDLSLSPPYIVKKEKRERTRATPGEWSFASLE